MKVLIFVAAFLTVAVQADKLESVMQVSGPAHKDIAKVVTPVPTTFAPTPAPTNFIDPTFAPTTAPTNFIDPTFAPTTAPTGSADFMSTPTPSTDDDATKSNKIKGVVGIAYSTDGTVGVAYATTRAAYEAETNASNDSGSSATVPIVIIGCLVGVLGVVAAAVIMKKRKAVMVEDGEEETKYSNAIHTPVVAKTKCSPLINTPDVEEFETDCFESINTYAV